MTFSVILRDPATGEFGAAIASSSPAVAARCVNLLDGVGGANSQNVTDPRLGPALLTQLQQGRSAQEALDAVIAAEDPATIIYRQLLVLDHQGRSAAYSGFESLGTHAHATRQNAVAGGNLLANIAVPDALVDAALSAEGSIEQRLQAALKALDSQGRGAAYSGENALGVNGHVVRQNVVAGGNMLASLDVLDALVETVLTAAGTLEERLQAAMVAAIEAGGEEGPVHSAGLAVVSDAGWRITDLRVDWRDDDPIGELGRILNLWLPQRDAYIGRGYDPVAAPSYGVPGDE